MPAIIASISLIFVFILQAPVVTPVLSCCCASFERFYFPASRSRGWCSVLACWIHVTPSDVFFCHVFRYDIHETFSVLSFVYLFQDDHGLKRKITFLKQVLAVQNEVSVYEIRLSVLMSVLLYNKINDFI